jgi:serine/threonine-protein kinase HipA
MTPPSSQLVLIGEQPVGRLQMDKNGTTEFRLLESYKAAFPRPVLGQVFIDDPDRVFKRNMRLPPWFSNLLPEGALRELVAKRADANVMHEYALLHQLRDDLPGNIQLRNEDDVAVGDLDAHPTPKLDAENENPWKFSLAGVQLKFSALRSGERGLTIPTSGAGGDWIVKLPDQRFVGVPANEYATMSWALASGIDVPTFMLVDTAEIGGLDALAPALSEKQAFAIRRFDRPQAQQRIHIEDFAQIVDVYPEQKYKNANYESLARLVLAVTSRAGFEQFVRRLVFIIASGNGDAHLKNWSLIYRDGRTADLSPAYDMVSTIQYMPNDELALNLAGSKRWDSVALTAFERLAGKLGLDRAAVVDVARASIEAVLHAWHTEADQFGYTSAQRDRITQHLAAVPLFKP